MKREQGAASQASKPAEKKEEKPAPKPNINNDQLNALRKEYQKQQKLFQRLEEDINKLKQEILVIESKLADPSFYSNKQEFMKVDEDYRKQSARLMQLNKDYDKSFEQIMELEEKLG